MIEKIVSSPRLMLLIKLLILFRRNDLIKQFFQLTDNDIEDFMTKYFDVKGILNLGDVYIHGFLDTIDNQDLYTFYILGLEYCLAKFNLQNDILKLYDTLCKQCLILSIETTKTDIKLKAVKQIKETIVDKLNSTDNDKSTLDKVCDLLKLNGKEI